MASKNSREIGLSMLETARKFDQENRDEIIDFALFSESSESSKYSTNHAILRINDDLYGTIDEAVHIANGIVANKAAEEMFGADKVKEMLNPTDLHILKYPDERDDSIVTLKGYHKRGIVSAKRLVFKDLSEDDKDIFKHKIQGKAIEFVSLYHWRKWKKIYSFDDDFVNELILTGCDNLFIPVEQFPFPAFYVSANILSNVDGFFVLKNGGKYKADTFTITYYDKASKEWMILTSDSEENNVSVSKLIKDTEDEIRNAIARGHKASIDIYDTLSPEQVVIYFSETVKRMIIILAYILSLDADISASNRVRLNRNLPKKAKSKVKKDPYTSDVYEVGVNIGAALKQSKIEASTRYDVHVTEGTEYTASNKRTPHVRKAHWHHYWTGARSSLDRTLILKWIAPTYVNGYMPSTLITGLTPVEK